MTELAWGAFTDTGRQRDINQDGVWSSAAIFVVADGMGGHYGGEVASAIVVEEMAKTTALGSLDELIKIVYQANNEVLDRAGQDPTLSGMGTTVVALAPMTDPPARLAAANIGDSRLYLRTADELVQLTDDHSVVEGMIQDGWITAEEAKVHPQRNVLTRALGVEEPLLVDVWELAAVAGDRYLLCSDGLTNELSDPEIMEILDKHDDPEGAAMSLVQAACAAGGRDNVTVVVVDVTEASADDHMLATDRVIATRKSVLADEKSVLADEVVEINDAAEKIETIAENETNEPHKETNYPSWPPSRFVIWAIIAATLLLLLLLVL